MTSTRLRPISPDDHPFLFALHVATMKELIDRTWGWDEVWQREDFESRLAGCRISIIEVEKAPVGAIYLELRPESVFIADLQILPDWQGRGIGTGIVRETVREATSSGRVTELGVLQLNPRARSLYERLGFVVTRVEEPFIYMRHDAKREGPQR
jgi:GNAT superfamily N-acetyltransferase